MQMSWWRQNEERLWKWNNENIRNIYIRVTSSFENEKFQFVTIQIIFKYRNLVSNFLIIIIIIIIILHHISKIFSPEKLQKINRHLNISDSTREKSFFGMIRNKRIKFLGRECFHGPQGRIASFQVTGSGVIKRIITIARRDSWRSSLVLPCNK